MSAEAELSTFKEMREKFEASLGHLLQASTEENLLESNVIAGHEWNVTS